MCVGGLRRGWLNLRVGFLRAVIVANGEADFKGAICSTRRLAIKGNHRWFIRYQLKLPVFGNIGALADGQNPVTGRFETVIARTGGGQIFCAWISIGNKRQFFPFRAVKNLLGAVARQPPAPAWCCPEE